MMMRGLLVLSLLTSTVLSLPVTSGPPDVDDVQVMKCIVEVLADVLSKPHPRPVSQECSLILKSDERLITILRHMDFLKELQEIALKGHEARAQRVPGHVMQAPQKDDVADRSMLEALGGPGERSILSQKMEDEGRDQKRGQDGEEPQQDVFGEVNGEHEGKSKSRESSEEWDLEKAEKREESGESRANMKGSSEEATEENDSDESKHGKLMSPREKKRHHGNEKETRAGLFSHSHEEEEEEDEDEGMKRLSKESGDSFPSKRFPLKKEKEVKGVSHHSKEVSEEEEEESEEKKRNVKKSLEEKELQMIARRTPEEKKVLEEEGSAVRKSEEQEIESLAAIESELESVAQKVHDLRRG